MEQFIGDQLLDPLDFEVNVHNDRVADVVRSKSPACQRQLKSLSACFYVLTGCSRIHREGGQGWLKCSLQVLHLTCNHLCQSPMSIFRELN